MLWFLDWSYLSFMILMFVFLMFLLAEKQIPSAFIIFLFFLVISLYYSYCSDKRTFSLYPQEHYSIIKTFNKDFENGFTLGELWCNYTEYNGELCKNYVAYVLKNQKITALEKQKDELEKQTKLEKEKAQKDKIRANYEKTLKEIIEKGDTQ